VDPVDPDSDPDLQHCFAWRSLIGLLITVSPLDSSFVIATTSLLAGSGTCRRDEGEGGGGRGREGEEGGGMEMPF
jgi:hypothetical protein